MTSETYAAVQRLLEALEDKGIIYTFLIEENGVTIQPTEEIDLIRVNLDNYRERV